MLRTICENNYDESIGATKLEQVEESSGYLPATGAICTSPIGRLAFLTFTTYSTWAIYSPSGFLPRPLSGIRPAQKPRGRGYFCAAMQHYPTISMFAFERFNSRFCELRSGWWLSHPLSVRTRPPVREKAMNAPPSNKL
jgi:hypothetical protein